MAVAIPQYTAQVIPQARGYGRVRPDLATPAAIADLGRAVSGLDSDVEQIVQRREEAEAGDYIATQFGEIQQQQSERFRDEQTKAAPGAKGFTKSFMDAWDKDIEARLESAPSERARQGLKTRADAIRLGFWRDAAEFEDRSGKALRLGNMEATANRYGNMALSNPGMYDAYRVALDDALALHAGDMPAQELDEARQKYGMQLAALTVQGKAKADPVTTLRELQSGSWDDRLAPESKVRLLGDAQAEINRREAEAERAENRRYTMELRAERLADKAREANELALTTSVLAGQASMDDVLKAARERNIKAPTVRVLAELIKQRDDPADDWQTVAGLQGLQMQGDPGIMDRVVTARAEGRITTATMQRFLNEEVEKSQSGGQINRPDVKDARRKLRESLQGREDPIFGVDPERGEMVARADTFFLERFRADTKTDPYRLAEEITRTFKGGAPEAGALPRSRYLVGTPEEPDIEGSIQALEAARASGEIDDLAASVEAAAMAEIFDAAGKRQRAR